MITYVEFIEGLLYWLDLMLLDVPNKVNISVYMCRCNKSSRLQQVLMPKRQNRSVPSKMPHFKCFVELMPPLVALRHWQCFCQLKQKLLKERSWSWLRSQD